MTVTTVTWTVKVVVVVVVVLLLCSFSRIIVPEKTLAQKRDQNTNAKKTLLPFFPPTQTRTKKFTNLPYKILLTLQTRYVLQPRKRRTDRASERGRTREDEPKSKPEANKGEQRWRHKEEEEEEEGTAEVD